MPNHCLHFDFWFTLLCSDTGLAITDINLNLLQSICLLYHWLRNSLKNINKTLTQYFKTRIWIVGVKLLWPLLTFLHASSDKNFVYKISKIIMPDFTKWYITPFLSLYMWIFNVERHLMTSYSHDNYNKWWLTLWGYIAIVDTDEGPSESYSPEPLLPIHVNMLGLFVVLGDCYIGFHLSWNTLALDVDGW